MTPQSTTPLTDALRVDSCEGKYTVVQDTNGRLTALRYGKEWRDCVGDGLILSLASDLDEERKKVAALTLRSNELERTVKYWVDEHGKEVEKRDNLDVQFNQVCAASGKNKEQFELKLAEKEREVTRLKSYLSGTPASHAEAAFKLSEKLGFGLSSKPPMIHIEETITKLQEVAREMANQLKSHSSGELMRNIALRDYASLPASVRGEKE